MSTIDELQRHWGVFPNGWCHCGCGGPTRGKRAYFIIGHDAFFAPGLLEKLRGNPDVAAAIRKLTS